MKRNLANYLVENSKTTKSVDGEMKTPTYTNIKSPDNHVDGKSLRTVDGKKGLDQRPAKKTVAQVTPPKKRERRPMNESKVGDAVAGWFMKTAGPAFGRDLYTSLKNEDPALYQEVLDKFKTLIRGGALTAKQQMNVLQNDPDAIDLAMRMQDWAEDKISNDPRFQKWAEKKRTQLDMDDHYGESVINEGPFSWLAKKASDGYGAYKLNRQIDKIDNKLNRIKKADTRSARQARTGDANPVATNVASDTMTGLATTGTIAGGAAMAHKNSQGKDELDEGPLTWLGKAAAKTASKAPTPTGPVAPARYPRGSLTKNVAKDIERTTDGSTEPVMMFKKQSPSSHTPANSRISGNAPANPPVSPRLAVKPTQSAASNASSAVVDRMKSKLPQSTPDAPVLKAPARPMAAPTKKAPTSRMTHAADGALNIGTAAGAAGAGAAAAANKAEPGIFQRMFGNESVEFAFGENIVTASLNEAVDGTVELTFEDFQGDLFGLYLEEMNNVGYVAVGNDIYEVGPLAGIAGRAAAGVGRFAMNRLGGNAVKRAANTKHGKAARAAGAGTLGIETAHDITDMAANAGMGRDPLQPTITKEEDLEENPLIRTAVSGIQKLGRGVKKGVDNVEVDAYDLIGPAGMIGGVAGAGVGIGGLGKLAQNAEQNAQDARVMRQNRANDATHNSVDAVDAHNSQYDLKTPKLSRDSMTTVGDFPHGAANLKNSADLEEGPLSWLVKKGAKKTAKKSDDGIGLGMAGAAGLAGAGIATAKAMNQQDKPSDDLEEGPISSIAKGVGRALTKSPAERAVDGVGSMGDFKLAGAAVGAPMAVAGGAGHAFKRQVKKQDRANKAVHGGIDAVDAAELEEGPISSGFSALGRMFGKTKAADKMSNTMNKAAAGGAGAAGAISMAKKKHDKPQ